MSTSRLQQQFIRLWQRCHGETTDTTLQDLAEVLSCSRRHVRSLLSAMQREGWLTWQAESGRGKRSRLTFHYTGLALQQQRAEELLEQDRIDQLVQLVGDKNVVRQMLLSQLGRSFRQGKHILRVLYYRQLYNLLPGSALRRSETHLARQIFNGLTRINEENGELESDLSHHWQALTPLHWRFYLRPAIHFHHGRELEMADVITSLSRLTSQPLFSHIESVTSPTPFVIDVQLRSPDHWLPWLLGSVQAMILPREWRELPDFARHPVGTGPYRMVRNHPSQMKIHAFDDYFGYRALIDEVNIWVLPEFSEELVHSGVQLQGDETGNSELESRLEEGCYFLLFDQRSPLAADPAIRSWLCELINPISLLSHAGPLYQRYWSPAYGLLPRWHHNRTLAQQPKPAGLTELTMTHFNEHSEFHAIRQAIEPLLAQHGIRLIVQSVDYATWHLLPAAGVFAVRHAVRTAAGAALHERRSGAGRGAVARQPLAAGRVLPASGQQPPAASAVPPLAAVARPAQHARRADEHPRLVRLQVRLVCPAGGISAFRPGRLIFTIAPSQRGAVSRAA